jgi:hypothetical protein
MTGKILNIINTKRSDSPPLYELSNEDLNKGIINLSRLEKKQ